MFYQTKAEHANKMRTFLVRQNDATVLSTGPGYSGVLNLSSGDTMDFLVTVGPDRSFLGDTTLIDVTISSPVPEPGAMLAVGIALAGLSVRHRARS